MSLRNYASFSLQVPYILSILLGADSDKIPEGGTSTYILDLSDEKEELLHASRSKGHHALCWKKLR